MQGKIKILNDYGWEESGFPSQYVDDFNRELDGITVMSEYVKKVLIDNGVSIPISPIGVGIDHLNRITPVPIERDLGKNYKILHISSGFPRKGIDVLLQAYSLAFSKDDAVTLILKTFPNIHNSVEDQIRKIQQSNPDCAEILLINEDMAYEKLVDLYKRCDVLVAPSRGEGFGLPMAEAMLLGIPVITTGFGGQRDFCTSENSWLVKYSFSIAETHMNLEDSVWAEPDVNHLAELMLLLKSLSENEIKKKTDKAKDNIQNNYKWSDCAKRLDTFVRRLKASKIPSDKKIRLGWVTSWNAKCGIASYSKFLIQAIDKSRFDLCIFASKKDILISPDEPFVSRCWENNAQPDLSEIKKQITDKKIEVLVIQFNFGFFDLPAFNTLIEQLHTQGIKIIIFFHATADIVRTDYSASIKTIAGSLKKADRLFIHGIEDLNRLKDFGLVDNVTLFPQGVIRFDPEDTNFIKHQFGLTDKKIIATYGFLLPHKGAKELILAFDRLHNNNPSLHLMLINALYPIKDSTQLRDECSQLIKQLDLNAHVTMINDYLTDQESILLLKCADLIVFPYQDTQESSSAAVRHGIASLKPVACTPLPIFDDVKHIVHMLPGTSPQQLIHGISVLLEDKQLRLSQTELQQDWVKTHSWSTLSNKLQNIILSLTDNGIT
jgi:glycosyltransferase involved in cell wall biosynthesis